MRTDFLRTLGEALRRRRQERGLSQPELARRLGRARARVTELELGLLAGKTVRDRLGLLVEACDALDMILVLAPREQTQAIRQLLSGDSSPPLAPPTGNLFDDFFIDLSDGKETR